MQLEGHGGRPRGEISEWDHFPTSIETTLQYLKLSGSEREGNNRKVFTSVANIVEDINEEKNDENDKDNIKGTHSLINLQRIESALNTNLSCDCHVDHSIEDFINYLIEKDPTFFRVKGMYESYQKYSKKIEKGKIIIKEKVIGIATSINIECNRCNRSELVSPSGTKYTGKNLKEKVVITAVVTGFSLIYS